MGSSTMVTSISEAVAANCLYSLVLAKRFAKQMKEIAPTQMTRIQIRQSPICQISGII
jgi:hypothetical protein